MQKLLKRKVKLNTPTNTSQVCSSVDLSLNNHCSSGDSEQVSKTFNNNSDEKLTGKGHPGQGLRVPVVYVLNQRGEALMPTSCRKAKILLKKGEAVVVRRTPFTVKLKKQTGEQKQEVILGVDSGYKHIGISAKTEEKELISAEVELRDNIVELLSERKIFRKTRRNRHHWYRKPRFLNRKNMLGKLSPSLQHKLDSHIKIIKLIYSLLPISKIIIETAKFDIQKIKNPEISEEEYQEGEQLGFFNIREYVLYRDNHVCQYCKKKDLILNVHHIISRKTGGNRPDNLITLCTKCHDKYHKNKIKLNIKIKKDFNTETCMNMIRKRIINKLKEKYIVEETFGYMTKHNRIKNKIEKSHINDAFVISGGKKQKRCKSYLIKQVRKQNRKLFKGKRSEIKNTERLIKGFNRFDKVEYKDKECFIFGRRSTGYFDIRKLNGEIIRESVSYKKLKLIEYFNTLLWEGEIVFLN